MGEGKRHMLLSETVTIKGLVDEDFVNYKVPSMTIMFPHCSFKCGNNYCQNSALANEPDIKIAVHKLYRRYRNNPISEAIVCQGLEPFDSWIELNSILFHFRIYETCFDPFVIYTGYTEDELSEKIEYIKRMYSNIIIKFGRYIPNNKPHYDDILGVNLSSDNQYAKVIKIE